MFTIAFIRRDDIICNNNKHTITQEEFKIFKVESLKIMNSWFSVYPKKCGQVLPVQAWNNQNQDFGCRQKVKITSQHHSKTKYKVMTISFDLKWLKFYLENL